MAPILSRLLRPASRRAAASYGSARVDSEIEFREIREPVGTGADVVSNGLHAAVATVTHGSPGAAPLTQYCPPSAVDAIATARSEVCPCPLWKRAIDIVGSILVLIALSPVLVAIVTIIACGSGLPILFRQQRYGLAGRPFFVWKFRTIKADEAAQEHQSYVIDRMSSDRPLEKRDDALSLVPCGRMLRKLGFDELPQLLNVLKGDMSLVGPRPDVVPLKHYQPWQMERFDVLPGITGLWQVSGKNRTTFDTMIQLDLAYIRQRSVLFDMSILLRTIPSILWS